MRQRVISIILDQVILTVIMMILFIPASIYFHISNPNVIGEKYHRIQDSPLILYWMLIVVSLYFNKDAIVGRSIAKRITKLQVLDVKLRQPADPIKCLIRNLTIFIWPVEALFIFRNPKRRLGDLIAGTELVAFSEELEPTQTKPFWGLIALSMALTVLMLGLLSRCMF